MPRCNQSKVKILQCILLIPSHRATLTLTADCDSLWVYAGSTYEGNKTVTISNFMIRPATIADSTYEPYAMSNAELTAKEQTNESNISSIQQTIGDINSVLEEVL